MTDEISAAVTEKTPEQLRAEAAAEQQPTAKPLEPLADEERTLDAGGPAGADPVAAAPKVIDPPREIPAADRVRAFEDEHFGKDAVRVNGQVERGSGSIYQQMSTERKREYAALENLVDAERKLGEAEAAVVLAETEHAAALAAAEPKE